jgi:hypothetical protein
MLTKILAGTLILGSASATLASTETNPGGPQGAREWTEHLGDQSHQMALASNNYHSFDWAPPTDATPGATTCPALEGYPDCHPDARPGEYSSGHPEPNRSQFQRRP